MFRTPAVVFAVVALTFGPAGSAAAADPGDDPKAILAAFAAERGDAATHFTPAELAAADDLFKRAEAALAADNPVAAARLGRDARWALPFRPAGLPEHVTRVIGTARLRHADRVNGLAYSPDGARLASASRDGTVRVWDLGNGRPIAVYRGHLREARPVKEDPNVLRVPAVAFAPDGNTVASSGGQVIHVWDAATGNTLFRLKGHTGVAKCLAFGPDANTLVSGGDDKTVILWDVRLGKAVYTAAGQTNRVEAVAFRPDGKLVAAINTAGELSVYNPADQKRLMVSSVTEKGEPGYGVAFAGDGTGIVTAGADTRPKLVAGPHPDGNGGGTGQVVRTFVGHTAKVNGLAATPDGRLFVTGGADKSVRVWEAATGKQLWSFQGHVDQVTAVAVRPDGKQAASGGDDGSIRLWPLTTADEHRTMADATAPLWTVAVSPDGTTVAAAGADKSIRLYAVETGKLTTTMPGHAAAVTAVTFLDDSHLASASGDKTVKLWNLADGSSSDLTGHESAVLAVAADRAGKTLVSGSVDKTVRGWNPRTRESVWTWAGKSAVCAVAVRPGGDQIAVGTADGTLTILAPKGTAAEVVGSSPAHQAGTAAVAYSLDGTRLATCGGDGVVRVWTVTESGTPTAGAKFEAPARSGSAANPMSAVAFSADGKLVAAAGADGIVHVWDAQVGTEVRGLRGHGDWVTAAAFAPDGRTLTSVSADQTVRLFDLSRRESEAAGGHAMPVRGVAINRDGTRAATAAEDATVKVWNLATGKELATLTGASKALNAVAFTGPDGVVAAGDDFRVRWWGLNPVRDARSTPSERIFNLAATPDGKQVVGVWAKPDEKPPVAAFERFDSAGDAAPVQIREKDRTLSCAAIAADATVGITGGADGSLRVWDLVEQERVGGDWPLFAEAVADVGLTPDKKTLVAIDVAGTVKIADATSREVKATIKSAVPAGQVYAMTVARTGDKFATLSDTGEVKVWSMAGEELRSWSLPTAANAAGFTPDGKSLVTGNRDGTLYVLELP